MDDVAEKGRKNGCHPSAISERLDEPFFAEFISGPGRNYSRQEVCSL
jgi:hypothetical protein